MCTGGVGAVFCIEASRLARNGRDWHHLIELCGLVRALVVDPDGVYDPGLLNDRLLLGLKGTMSEFELEPSPATLPGSDSPERLGAVNYSSRCPSAIAGPPMARSRWIQIVASSRRLGWSLQRWPSSEAHGKCCSGSVERKSVFPALMHGESGRELVWKLPVYNTIWHMLRNPMYAGGYAFGKTEARTRVVEGRARKTIGHFKPVDNWTVLIRDHHHWLHYLGAV